MSSTALGTRAPLPRDDVCLRRLPADAQQATRESLATGTHCLLQQKAARGAIMYSAFPGRERSDDLALGQREPNTARCEEAQSDGPLAIGTLQVHKWAVSASMIRRRSR